MTTWPKGRWRSVKICDLLSHKNHMSNMNDIDDPGFRYTRTWVYNSFRSCCWSGLGFLLGFLSWYHLPCSCISLELEPVNLHGICYMLACAPSILHSICYILALQPFILHGLGPIYLWSVLGCIKPQAKPTAKQRTKPKPPPEIYYSDEEGEEQPTQSFIKKKTTPPSINTGSAFAQHYALLQQQIMKQK